MKFKTSYHYALALLCATVIMQPVSQAKASTMPKAEVDRSSISIGLGPSVSLDSKIGPMTSLGGSLGLPFLVSGGTSGRYDLRLTHRFLHQNNFSLSGIFGVWGNARFDQPSRSRYVGLELGLGLAYQFTPQLTGRLNLVPGLTFPFTPGGIVDYYPPAGGFELAYRFNSGLEGTLGYNGQGDVLGLRFTI
jgi:hypothetical protein